MAGYGDMAIAGPSKPPMVAPLKASSAPATAPKSTSGPTSSATTIAPTGGTSSPILSSNLTTQAPTLSPVNSTTSANNTRLLLNSNVYGTSLINPEREMQENITLMNETSTAVQLPENVTATGLPPELLNNASTSAPTNTPATSSSLAPSGAALTSGNEAGVTTSSAANATLYYIALAEGITAALENNRTSVDVAQALLFMEGVSSKCIPLVEAAKFYSKSELLSKELQGAIGIALDSFSQRIPTAAPVAVTTKVTKAPVKVRPTKQPVKGTSAPAAMTNNSTSAPAGTTTNTTANGTTVSSYNAVSFKVQYKGDGWIGLGVSEIGMMVGSVAVIGLPTSQGNNVSKYNLNSKDTAGIVPMDSSMQNLQNANIVQGSGNTFMRFETLLDWNNGVLSFSPTANNQMIWAYGTTNTLEYHAKNRGTFLLNLGFCLDPANAESQDCKPLDTSYDQMKEISPSLTVYSKSINL